MTLEVGRKLIKLEWPAAGSILLLIISFTWGAAIYYVRSEQDKKDIKQDITIIKTAIVSIVHNDSTYIKAQAKIINARIDSLAKIQCSVPARRKKMRTAFYTESKAAPNGDVTLHRIK